MASSDLLPCLEKRALLNDASESSDALSSWGERYEGEALFSDAVDFYEKAGNGEALGRLLERVKQEGDFFLFNRICRILKRQPLREDWRVLAEQAERLGKLAFAAQARLKEQEGGGERPR